MLSDPFGSLKDVFGLLGQHPIVLLVIVGVVAFSMLNFGDHGQSGTND
jgi:hypothetical protein